MQVQTQVLTILKGSIVSILIVMLVACGGSGSSDDTGGSSSSILPDISLFKTNPTEQFLVDMSLVQDAHSYRGENCNDPHAGAHVHVNNSENAWPSGGVTASYYPPIYAIADGIVDHIDTYYAVGSNYRYGVSLKIATKDGSIVTFYYSIEPMLNPEDSDFYKPFISVEAGDTVEKGDVIAYFYLAPNDNSNNAHIHFHMNYNSGFLAPCIFTDTLVTSFHAKFGVRGVDGADALPNTMCYKLSADENPFESVAVDTL
ncbi:hypothetical protein DID77_00735 [Candidatus Marinamargulisbacteria bacterium SCGC AG-439-L15]|nr:hypothetical protein DID77_00735 [Candidatus Marinamargulisbacteria bacterium SCGC AG-439-L15]